MFYIYLELSSILLILIVLFWARFSQPARWVKTDVLMSAAQLKLCSVGCLWTPRNVFTDYFAQPRVSSFTASFINEIIKLSHSLTVKFHQLPSDGYEEAEKNNKIGTICYLLLLLCWCCTDCAAVDSNWTSLTHDWLTTRTFVNTRTLENIPDTSLLLDLQVPVFLTNRLDKLS